MLIALIYAVLWRLAFTLPTTQTPSLVSECASPFIAPSEDSLDHIYGLNYFPIHLNHIDFLGNESPNCTP